MFQAAARVTMIGLLLVAAPARAAGPRITVGPVQGAVKPVIPTQLAELLCGTYDCVLWKDVSTRRAPDLAKARALGVKGILTGAVGAKAVGKVTLSLFTTSPRPAKTWSFTLTAAGRLPASATRQLEQDLTALLRPPAPAAAPPPVRPVEPVAEAPRAPPPEPLFQPAPSTAPTPAVPSAPRAAAPVVLTAPTAPGEGRWVAAAELGFFVDQRKLNYGGVTASTGTLRGFDASGVAGAGASLEVFPMARGASVAVGGLGLHASLAMSVGLKTEVVAGDQRPTQYTRLEIGARWRAPPLTGLKLVLVPDVAWVSQKMSASPAIAGLPDSDLSGVRVKLSAEARVSSRITILAGLGWVKWLTAKDLIKGDPAFFPGSGASALEAEVGAGVAVWGPLSVRVVGKYASTRYTLDPDPTGTYAATSAEDRYLGLRAMLRGEF